MKILIAEDDAVSRRTLEAYLEKWGYEVAVAADGNEAWTLLQGEDAPRLAILDWMMPGKDGLEVCAEVRKVKGAPYTYVIILTALDRKEDVVRGLDAGADDYVTKPYDPLELRARLRAARRILALQEALLSARDALRFQATFDPLTGVWSRNAILATLRRELARAEREKTPLAVFMADLDHFSRTNATFGHAAGDSVLRETAQRMRSASRLYDSIGRYGGEEFLIIAPGCDGAEALRQGERLRASVAGKAIDLADGSAQLTLSVGVVTTGRKKGLDANAVIFAADAALSRAKEGGRDRLELAHSDELAGTLSAKPPGLAA